MPGWSISSESLGVIVSARPTPTESLSETEYRVVRTNCCLMDDEAHVIDRGSHDDMMLVYRDWSRSKLQKFRDGRWVNVTVRAS